MEEEMQKRILWNNENCNYSITIIPKREADMGTIIYLSYNQIGKLRREKINNPYDQDLHSYIQIFEDMS